MAPIPRLTPMLQQSVDPSRAAGIIPWWRSLVAEARAHGKTVGSPETRGDLSAVSWSVD
jgi:hypothetical protein